jgi:hypothetical protein
VPEETSARLDTTEQKHCGVNLPVMVVWRDMHLRFGKRNMVYIIVNKTRMNSISLAR